MNATFFVELPMAGSPLLLTLAVKADIGQRIRVSIYVLFYTGKLSCFRPGISTCLLRSMASARASRRRVACGMITSSI